MAPIAGGLVLSIVFLPLSGFADEDGPLPQDAREVFVQSLADRSDRWTCPIARQFRCHVDACERIQPTVTIHISFDQTINIYERCDAEGCDRYQVTPHRSGLFTIIAPSPGALFKAVNDGSEFVETVTTGTIVFNGFGSCSPSLH
jgi:hypothetical protein